MILHHYTFKKITKGENKMSYQKLAFIILGLFVFLLIVGCGLKEGVVQKEAKSYLWFTGNTEGVIVYIDDLKPIELGKNYYTDSETGEKIGKNKEIHYELTPGKHRIIVKKMEAKLVNRIVLLGNGIIKEIKIP